MDSLVDKVASFIDEFLDYLPGSEFEIDALEEA